MVYKGGIVAGESARGAQRRSRFAQSFFPRRQANAERRREPAVVQHRIGGALRRQRVFAGADRGDGVGEAEFAQDGGGKAVPGRARPSCDAKRRGRPDRARAIASTVARASVTTGSARRLVGHHARRFASRARRGRKSSCAGRMGQSSCGRSSAGRRSPRSSRRACSRRTHGIRGVLLDVQRGRATVEDVVGGVVDQRAPRRCFAGQRTRRAGVDGDAASGSLGAVHRGVAAGLTMRSGWAHHRATRPASAGPGPRGQRRNSPSGGASAQFPADWRCGR